VLWTNQRIQIVQHTLYSKPRAISPSRCYCTQRRTSSEPSTIWLNTSSMLITMMLPTPDSSFCSNTSMIDPSRSINYVSPILLLKLPSELLLHVLLNLEDKDILSLKRASRHFRTFVTSHGRVLCNAFIERDFGGPASMFKPALINGWLTPTHPMIIQQEVAVAKNAIERMEKTREGTSLLHEGPLLRCRISVPGPAFLKFLRKQSNLWIEYKILQEGSVTPQAHAGRLALYYVKPFLNNENMNDGAAHPTRRTQIFSPPASYSKFLPGRWTSNA
jgi:hypothetical protein